MAEVADELRQAAVGDVGHLRRQPQHQLHQRLHVQVQVLRLFQGPAVAQLARAAPICSGSRRSPARVVEARQEGATEVCLQGGIHPDFDGEYYLEVLKAVRAGLRAHPHPRLHRPRGERRGAPARRAARVLSRATARRRAANLAGHRGGDPRRRDPGRSCARTRSTPSSGSRCTESRTASACARTSRSCSGRSSRPRHWARHLVRTRALQKETGGFTEFVPLPFVHMASPDLPAAKGAPGPDVSRDAPHARRGPHRLPRLDRQHPGELGEDRRRRRQAAARLGLQRPRRDPHGREHLPGRRREPRPAHGGGRLPRDSPSRSAAVSSSARPCTGGSPPSAG